MKEMPSKFVASHDFTAYPNGEFVCIKCGLRRIVHFEVKPDQSVRFVFEHPDGERECISGHESARS